MNIYCCCDGDNILYHPTGIFNILTPTVEYHRFLTLELDLKTHQMITLIITAPDKVFYGPENMVVPL